MKRVGPFIAAIAVMVAACSSSSSKAVGNAACQPKEICSAFCEQGQLGLRDLVVHGHPNTSGRRLSALAYRMMNACCLTYQRAHHISNYNCGARRARAIRPFAEPGTAPTMIVNLGERVSNRARARVAAYFRRSVLVDRVEVVRQT
jgi:hypothetical protein